MNDNVESIAEWQALPQPTFSTLKNASDKGSVYHVFKVGFLVASPKDCERSGIKAKANETGKCFLPTAVMDVAGEKQLCRLPLELTNWATTVVGMATTQGVNVFPTDIEFGILDGRTYAEML
jgi:hypothetical protein